MDTDRARRLLLALKQELASVDDSYELALALVNIDSLEQAFWRIGINARAGSGSPQNVNVDNRHVVDKAYDALLEMGSTSRHANAIVQHFVNRGILVKEDGGTDGQATA